MDRQKRRRPGDRRSGGRDGVSSARVRCRAGRRAAAFGDDQRAVATRYRRPARIARPVFRGESCRTARAGRRHAHADSLQGWRDRPSGRSALSDRPGAVSDQVERGDGRTRFRQRAADARHAPARPRAGIAARRSGDRRERRSERGRAARGAGGRGPRERAGSRRALRSRSLQDRGALHRPDRHASGLDRQSGVRQPRRQRADDTARHHRFARPDLSGLRYQRKRLRRVPAFAREPARTARGHRATLAHGRQRLHAYRQIRFHRQRARPFERDHSCARDDPESRPVAHARRLRTREARHDRAATGPARARCRRARRSDGPHGVRGRRGRRGDAEKGADRRSARRPARDPLGPCANRPRGHRRHSVCPPRFEDRPRAGSIQFSAEQVVEGAKS